MRTPATFSELGALVAQLHDSVVSLANAVSLHVEAVRRVHERECAEIAALQRRVAALERGEAPGEALH